MAAANRTYGLTLSIYYETNLGQSIGVIGSTEELGRWKEVKVHLKWKKGHVWVMEQPLLTKYQYFKYKYVLLKNDEIEKWESGIDRIADLELLPEVY